MLPTQLESLSISALVLHTLNHICLSQAPQVLGISPVFTESSSGVCLTQMVVKFNTDTNVPVVEIEHKLDSLLTFSPASLASTPHRGYWRDYKTLVIVFRECVQWEREEEQRKPLYVVFYGSEGTYPHVYQYII